MNAARYPAFGTSPAVAVIVKTIPFPGVSLLSLLLLLVASIPLPAQEKAAAPARWTDARYGNFNAAAFREYAPAGRIVEPGSLDLELLAAAVFYASNEQRAKHRVPPLHSSPALRRAAQGHSEDMASGGFFAHDNPKNPARRTPWQRMAEEGVPGGFRAENIAMTSAGKMTYLQAADTIIAMWMKSPGHRRNLLNPRMRYLGCGVAAGRGKRFELLATQNFASEVPAARPASR